MIVFIGAGVSKLFGVPDTKGFIEIFDNEPQISQSEIYTDIKKRFGEDIGLEVLMTILDDLNEPDFWERISPQTTRFLLETFTLESVKRFVIDSNTRKESRRVFEKIKSIIRDQCHSAPVENKSDILDIYDRFFDTISKVSGEYRSGDGRIQYPRFLRFVTTNYDRCIETYFGTREVEFVQGLVPRFGYEEFDASSGFLIKGGLPLAHPNAIELFKLHGSIDLFNIDGRIRRRIYGEDIGEEVIYYPIEYGGYRHIIESPYLELFYLFRQRISQDNQWIIIGTSLRDRTICSIMNDVIRLERGIERPKIIFVNPDKTVIDRLRNWDFVYLADRIRSVNERFGSDETNEIILKHLQSS